ncbi:hypothetical protein IBX73_02030 [candidate division WOR-3 bacterium]|nr:hypothetical protein [candidate division WOR-3 bacterium]
MLNRIYRMKVLGVVPMGLILVVLSTGFLFGQWETDVRLTTDADSSYTSYNNAWCVAASGDTVHVAWYDGRDGNEEIYYKLSTDNGSNWDADARLTDDMSISQLASVAASGSMVHVVWSDERNSNWDIYYKRNPTGNTGISEYTDGVAEGFSLVAAPNPFTHTTRIGYSILDSGYLIQSPGISIYDATGCLVRSLYPESSIQNQGSEVWWDGRDDHGRQLGGGVYFVRLSAGVYTATEKLLLVR